jgi:drug/metabolite transporter (DMT)-like permease
MRATDWMLLVFLSLLWGLTFFFAAVALREVPPPTLVLARVAIAALVLLPLIYAFGHRLPRTLAGWQPFVMQSLLNNVIPFTLMFYGQQRIASGLAAVLNATTPLFTLIIARLFAGEPLTLNKTVGIGLGIAGVAILMGPAAAGADAGSLIGMLCVLGTALSYGFAALWMRRLREVPPLVSSGAQLTCSTLLLLPAAATVDRFWLLAMPDATTIGAVLGLAVFSTALAYIVFFRISATAGPANVMLVTLLIPISATALGVLLLDEALTPQQFAGALVIGSGLVVIDGRLFRRQFTS